jgi:hypothetical protein
MEGDVTTHASVQPHRAASQTEPVPASLEWIARLLMIVSMVIISNLTAIAIASVIY